jgi:response regulator RpfG family c-di-GMP phosphodiesterase
MSAEARPRILVVDDEEAILETMTFTFEDDYEVYTSTDARKALEILDEKEPVAAVLTDQRMPNMSGVEFVTEVCKRHPQTVRMVLTGFSDMDAIIQAINAGHVYAYITKPWEPDQLKQLMKQAVEHHRLSVENLRLLADQRRANLFLEAVMDQLDTGALAVDAAGDIQAVNRPAREYLALAGELRGRALKEVLESHGREAIGAAVYRLAADENMKHDDVVIEGAERAARLRITVSELRDQEREPLGQVILLREISHEPLLRRVNEVVHKIAETQGEVRGVLEGAKQRLEEHANEMQGSRLDTPGMSVLFDRLARTRTAIDNWLEVDDALAREDYPDAQLLQDRIRVASARWPVPDAIPDRVRDLARRVEEYYDSGENPKQRVL